MDALTLMLIGTGILAFFLILFVFLFMLAPPPKQQTNNASIRAIKQQVEEEVVSETVPYKLPKDGKRPMRALPADRDE